MVWRDAYLGKRANWFPERTDLAPMMEPTRHKPAYVADCLDQIDAIAGDVQRYADRLDDHLSALKATISSHLWVTPDFVGPATSSLEETRGTVSSLSSRVDRLRTGFESLPQDSDADIFAGGDGLDEAAEDVPLEEDAAAGRPRRPRRRYVRT